MPTDEPARSDKPDRLVRPPKWRTRTTPERRHRAATATFAIVVGVGLALVVAITSALDSLGAGPLLVVMPWLAPTVAVVVWTLVRPSVARVTDDDDDTWFGYAIRWVLVGEDEPRSASVRLVAALLFGGPVGWSLLVVALLTVLGLA